MGLPPLSRVKAFLRPLLCLCCFLNAALPAAFADVQVIAPLSTPADIDFVYHPDRPVSASWFRLLLRNTGLEIWLELIRDELFVDTTDELNRIAFAPAFLALALSAQQSDYRNISKDCEISPSSADANCEIVNDLLSDGWTNPSSTSGTRNQNALSSLLDSGYALSRSRDGGYTLYRTRGTLSIGELQAYVEALVALAGIGGCCGVGPLGFEENIGSVLASEPEVVSDSAVQLNAFSYNPPALSGPAIVPEPPISVLLVIGMGGLFASIGLQFRQRVWGSASKSAHASLVRDGNAAHDPRANAADARARGLDWKRDETVSKETKSS